MSSNDRKYKARSDVELASMNADQQREIASRIIRATRQKNTVHPFDSIEARETDKNAVKSPTKKNEYSSSLANSFEPFVRAGSPSHKK